MSSDHKYKRLDSVRGLAAFAVGVGHAVLCVPFSKHYWWSYPIVGIFNGYYAVDIFFVLSGFVLTHMVRGFSGPNYGAYVGRRLLRLYPPLWAGLALAYAAHVFVAAHGWSCEGISSWACQFVTSPASFFAIVKSAIPTNYQLDPVVWSIRIELEASLVYPFMLLLWKRSNTAGRIAMMMTAVLMACGFDAFSGGRLERHYFFFLLGLPHFLFLFLAGIAVSDWRISCDSHASVALTSGTALMLVSGFFVRGHSGTADLIAGASATLLIAVVAYRCPSWLGAVLDNRAIRRLGEISYSYYLVNAVVLWLLARMFAGPLTATLHVVPVLRALVLMGFLAIGATLLGVLVADVMNRVIEKPSIVLSRAFERQLVSLFGNAVRTRTAQLGRESGLS